jgi:hypothetical protein
VLGDVGEGVLRLRNGGDRVPDSVQDVEDLRLGSSIGVDEQNPGGRHDPSGRDENAFAG